MGRVRALLAPEVRFGVAGLVRGIGHRLGLGLRGLLVGVCGGLLGWWRRRTARIIVVNGWRAVFGLEAFH